MRSTGKAKPGMVRVTASSSVRRFEYGWDNKDSPSRCKMSKNARQRWRSFFLTSRSACNGLLVSPFPTSGQTDLRCPRQDSHSSGIKPPKLFDPWSATSFALTLIVRDHLSLQDYR